MARSASSAAARAGASRVAGSPAACCSSARSSVAASATCPRRAVSRASAAARKAAPRVVRRRGGAQLAAPLRLLGGAARLHGIVDGLRRRGLRGVDLDPGYQRLEGGARRGCAASLRRCSATAASAARARAGGRDRVRQPAVGNGGLAVRPRRRRIGLGWRRGAVALQHHGRLLQRGELGGDCPRRVVAQCSVGAVEPCGGRAQRATGRVPRGRGDRRADVLDVALGLRRALRRRHGAGALGHFAPARGDCTGAALEGGREGGGVRGLGRRRRVAHAFELLNGFLARPAARQLARRRQLAPQHRRRRRIDGQGEGAGVRGELRDAVERRRGVVLQRVGALLVSSACQAAAAAA
jgi:hypothetical protein